MNLQERRRELNIEQATLAKKVGTNAPMMSNFENYRCLPIPAMLKAICKELKCDVLDIYKQHEIYISKTCRKGEKDKPEYYRLTADLPNEAREVFSSKNLQKCGYHSLKDFIWHCYKWLEKRQNAKKEKSTKHVECSVDYENDIAPIL